MNLNRKQFLQWSVGPVLAPATLGHERAEGAQGTRPRGRAGGRRQSLNFNRQWRFQLGDPAGAEAAGFDDGAWKEIGLPHSFSLPYFASPQFYVGYGWYRKPLTVPGSWAGKLVHLEFDGAFQVTELFVNGRRVGEHRGGYTGFTFDLTDFVHTGRNLVALRVNNFWDPRLAPRAGEHTFSGGLYRNVRLVVTAPLHVAWYGTHVTTPHVSKASGTVSVKTEVVNDAPNAKAATVRTRIADRDGRTVAQMQSTHTVAARSSLVFDQGSPAIPGPHLWHPDGFRSPWGGNAYPTDPADEAGFEQSVKDSLRDMIRTHRNHPSIIVWSMDNEVFFSAGQVMPKVRRLLSELVAQTHALDPTRPAAIGGCQRGDIDILGDVAGYNGDGARLFPNPGIPNVVTEYGSTIADRPGKYEPGWGDLPSTPGAVPGQAGSWRLPRRSGEALWCAFDHGSLAGRAFGAMGFVDYFRLPKCQWYWYRDAYRHIPPPEWPSEGTPTGLRLTADKTVLQRVDGTDDAHLVVTVVSADGKAISSSPPVTLTLVFRAGRIPDGAEHHLRAGLGHRHPRRHGRHRVPVVLRRQERHPRDVSGPQRCGDGDHLAGRAGLPRGQDPACAASSLCALRGERRE